MWGFTNSGGSDLLDAFAIIAVSYPEGSTCTCSNGAVTLTAGNTSGMWAFGVPSDGEWTLIAAKDGQTTSATVSITESGQIIYVNLSFSVLLSSVSLEYVHGSATSVSRNVDTGIFTVRNGSGDTSARYFHFTQNITDLIKNKFPNAKKILISPVDATGDSICLKTGDRTYIGILPMAVDVPVLPTVCYVGTLGGQGFSWTFKDILFEQVE